MARTSVKSDSWVNDDNKLKATQVGPKSWTYILSIDGNIYIGNAATLDPEAVGKWVPDVGISLNCAS